MKIAQRAVRAQPFHAMSIGARARELESRGIRIAKLSLGEPSFGAPPGVHEAMRAIMALADRVNQFVDAEKPWELAKDPAQTAKLHNLVSVGITPVYNNDVAVHCNYNLRFFAHQRENKGAEFTSRLCIYYLIDTLIEFYRQLKKGDEPI